MADEQDIDIVKISYEDIKKIVLSSRNNPELQKPENDNRKGNSNSQQQKSRRPAQQIYRPGRYGKGKPRRGQESEAEGAGHSPASEKTKEDWDSAVAGESDSVRSGRESSGEVPDDSLHQRLDDLYIESPPREIKGQHCMDESESSSKAKGTQSQHRESAPFEGDKDHGKKRRGKRPDMQVYVPRARLGQRDRRSEEKEGSPSMETPDTGKENRHWDATDKDGSEIVISNSPDHQRKVQVQNKGRAMRVTVLKESSTSSEPVSPNSKDSFEPSSKSGRESVERRPSQVKDSARAESIEKQRPENEGERGGHLSKDREKPGRQDVNKVPKKRETPTRGEGAQAFQKSSGAGRSFQERAETSRGGKSYRQNRRSNSNDSRHNKSEQYGKDSEAVISRTFPRSKGAGSKSAMKEQESGDQDNMRRDASGKGNGRDNEKFYWGMRRQRTGSISSEASAASNNGSFYSGSSDFTEDDEPEHILDWGAEVEKAHLEEVARLVNDGAQRLTSSLDAYPDGSPSNMAVEAQLDVPAGLDCHKSAAAAGKLHQAKREDMRPQGRRNRRRKNSSLQGSRDSSVHSSIHDDDNASERGHRRRRHRRGSKDSQSGYSDQHHPKHRHGQQPGPDTGRAGGDGGWGNMASLQVTVGHNNRHVALSPQAGGATGSNRRRHKSNDTSEPYTVDSGGEDWDKEVQTNMARSWREDEAFWPDNHYDNQGPVDRRKSPRFQRKKGDEGSGRGRQRKGSGGGGRFMQGEEPHYETNRRERQRLNSTDHGEDRRKFDDSGFTDRNKPHVDHKGGQHSDQRLLHPAYDASSRRPGTRGRGRGQAQRQGGSNRGWDNNRMVGRAMSEDCEDHHTLAQTAERGLLRMPAPSSQQELPRPSSTPSAAERHFAQQHPQHRHGTEDSSCSSRGSNMRGPIHGAKQLFDPKNPSKPIVISEGTPPPLKFEEADTQSSPASGSGFGPPSPDSPNGAHQMAYPQPMFPPDYPPMYGYRPRMPPFMPPGPFMRGFPPGSLPPHPAFYGYPQMPPPVMPPFYNSMDADSESMAAASRSQSRLMAEQILRDSHPFDCQLGNIMSRRPYSDDSIRVLNQIRAELQSRLERVILLDIEVANKHGVEQALWKSVYYQVIEAHRRRMGEEADPAGGRQRLMEVLEEGTHFFESLLKKLQDTYEFDLEQILDGSSLVPESGSRLTKLALLCVQKVMMFLGDIARYREQSSESTNYGKARQWYLKAQKIHPRNGRPYNQLAILAVYTRRKLDAVYYYMRSLAASNPILTARESLMSIFDEVRKKVDIVEKKRFQEREQRMELRRKRQTHGPRVEIWILPDGTSTQGEVDKDEEEEDLSSLSAVELNKRFVLTFLNVHGKLFTKINFEVFAESSSLMLLEFESLIQHSPCVFSSTRLLQLMVINMFSIENTALKDETLEESCRSLLQEHAVEIALEMFGLLVRRSMELLELQQKAQADGSPEARGHSQGEDPIHAVGGWSELLSEDLHNMLPALKTWVDWMMCHAHLWNPQPFNRPPELGPHIDVWENLAKFCDLLNGVETKQGCLIREHKPGYEPVVLHEDATLAGFIPMLSAPQEVFYADSSVDKRQAEDWLRIEKLRLFGEYLCGVEPPMLSYNVESGKYYSVAPQPSQSEEKINTDSQVEEEESGDESDDVVIEHDDSESDGDKGSSEKDDIKKLKDRKEKLKKQKRQREKEHENREAILDSHKHAKIELEIRPIFLIPDTNCFIDHFLSLRKILHSKKYTLVLPLVVINELDGLARGAKENQQSRQGTTSPEEQAEHARLVQSQAQAAISFLEDEFEAKNPNLRALTARGSVLETIAFRSEEAADNAGINDDIILNCCLHYCKDMARDFMPKGKDEPVRLHRDVVLLTEDRNLRLKAHTCNVPVKDVPKFKRWSKIV
ncbi:telomerase-binding protein est1a [Plakobranchus ocellatus]|uniref:Telomerase-binding protein est1a n=1 Tax=Plakobranchus ocellatus TaxID=259542 RepID=A0AAV3ZEE1_9GAST|nr:telomerase-binding protein est1a [Plakobranchus ocellatus]